MLLLLSSVGSGTTRNVDYRMRSAAFKEWKNEWSVINYELKISSGIINLAWELGVMHHGVWVKRSCNELGLGGSISDNIDNALCKVPET